MMLLKHSHSARRAASPHSQQMSSSPSSMGGVTCLCRAALHLGHSYESVLMSCLTQPLIQKACICLPSQGT